MEIWKPIEGHDGYEASNFGRIRSYKRGSPRILKQFFCKYGYLYVMLSVNGKQCHFNVHRLVAQAFISNPDNKPCVNHINGVKFDNRVENLEWVTYSENARHAYNMGLFGQGENHSEAKLTNEQVVYIRNNPDHLTLQQLGEMSSVHFSTIGYIQRGITYKNAGGNIRDKQKMGEYHRIPDDIRIEIRRLYVKGSKEFGCYGLAKKYDITPQTVWNIINKP